MAASADLGFILEAREGGHSLTVFERSSDTWTPLFEGSIEHTATARDRANAFTISYQPVPAPSAGLSAELATRGAAAAFAFALRIEGLPAGLRAYARNQKFHLLLNGEWPMQLAAVDRQLSRHPLRGELSERSSFLSRDGTLFFAEGRFVAAGKQAAMPYAALWQYDPKVSNWGLRILLLGGGPPK